MNPNASKTIKTIGLTGGIGSGKSTFCSLMQQNGIPFIDTDQIAREVVSPNSKGLQAVISYFGDTYLQTDGSLDRSALRHYIFSHPSEKAILEQILHPLIQQETKAQINAIKQTHSDVPIILVAIPLLTENMQKTGEKPDYIDEIWVIDTSEEQQLQTAAQRDKSDIEQIKKIMSQQASRQQRLAIADRVINNHADLTLLEQQVVSLCNDLKSGLPIKPLQH